MEALCQLTNLVCLGVGERLGAIGAMQPGKALIDVGAIADAIGGALRNAINDEPIAKVQDGALVIPPCTTTTDAIRAVDTCCSLLRKETAGCCGPVGASLGWV